MKNFNNFTNLMNGVLKKGPSGEVKRTKLEKASIEHPLESGGNQVETSIKPCIWKYAAMMALLLTLACGQMWGATLSFDVTSPGNKSITQNNITVSTSNDIASKTFNGTATTAVWKVDSNPTSITSTTANICKIVFTACNNSTTNNVQTCCVTVSTDGSTYTTLSSGVTVSGATGTTSTSTDNIYANGYNSYSTITVEFNSTNYRYVRIEKDGKETWVNSIKVYTASSGRYYDGTEKLFFLRDALSGWSGSSAKFYAYFYNNTTSTNAWSEAASWQVQTTSGNKDVWAYTVPEGTWEGVILTRHPSGTTTPTFDNKWNQSDDITLDANKNLITDWTVAGDWDDGGHAITWSNITLDGKTVYFDNRNYSGWTSAYVRIGKSDHNAAWGPMTKVGGTKYLYEKETDQYDFHTDLSVADSYGWTNGNNIYQPWENQSWSAPAKISKQTTYQKFGIQRDVYLCPTSTSMLERECQYYNVNGGTSTNTFDNVNTGTVLPQYEVTASGTNCTVDLVQYTNDALTTTSALSSGGSVDPTRYIGVTVTPSTGYEFSSISLTEDAYEQHTAAAAGVVGKYAILADCEISATCTPETYNITYKDGGATDNISFSGEHIGTAPTTHTYNTATTLKKACKAGYVFGGWYKEYGLTNNTNLSVGATEKTADFKLYAKWTAMSMVDLVSGTFYGASDMVPAGVTVSGSSQAYPGVSADQRFNMLGTTSTAMSSKTMSSTSLINASAVTEYLDFEGSASLSTYTPSTNAVQFKIPAAGQLEVWANSGIYLSNGSSETSISPSSNYAIVTVAAGTYYLYAQNTSRKLYGIRYKKTHSVSAVTSTGTTTYGTVSASPTTVAEDSASIITAVPATGYQVTNWAKTSGTGASISPSGSSNSNTTTLTMGTTDATVTVTFGAINYSVTYSSPSNGDYTIKVGDGSATSATKTANYGNTITLAATPEEGYEFSVWTITNTSTSADVTASVSLSDANDKDATFTMPAYGVTVTATFAALCTDPSASLSDGAYTIGGSALNLRTLWSSSNTTDGVTFTVTDANGTGATIAGDGYSFSATTAGTATISASQTSTGDYCDAAETATITVSNPTYTVTYNANDKTSGSAPSDASSPYESGSTVTVLGNTGSLARTGYVFCGWSTSYGGGTFYAPGDKFDMGTANVNLYPVWGQSLTWAMSYSASASAMPTPTKTSSNNTELPQANMSNFSTSTNVSLDASSGKADASPKITDFATAVAAGDEGIYVTFNVASGYQFTPLRMTMSTTAVSAAKTIKVSVGSNSQTWSQDKSGSSTPTAHEYVFSSPSAVSGSGVKVNIQAYGDSKTQKFRLGTPITIYGIVEATGYSISFAGNGETSGSTASVTSITSGSDVSQITANGFAKNGYTFDGWKTNTALTYVAYGDEDIEANRVAVAVNGIVPDKAKIKNVTSDITLTAQWSPNTYDITYNLNGASWADAYSAPATYTVGTGATLPTSSNMTNTGYTFDGWKDNSSLTGDSKTTIGTSEYGDKEFWAKWTENTYTITYNANGGSGSTSSTNGHYVTVANNGFTYASHVFAGWNTKSGGDGYSYGEGDEIELTANMTLYAIWADDYNVTWGNVQIGGAGDAVTPNLGGKNYTITATIATWTGDVTDIELGDVTSGVTASITGTTSSPSKTVTITFAVGTSVVGSSINLSLNVPAHGDYGAKVATTEEIDIERCGGSAGATTIFSNDFSTATAVAYVNDGSSTYSHSYNTSSTLSNLVGSGTNLFTSLASSIKKGNIAVNSSTGGNSVDATGFFQVYGNGDNTVYWSLNRTSDFAATAPTALQVSMDIWYKNLSSGSSIGVQFAVGDGFSDGLASGTSQASSKVHSGFGIHSNSTAKLYAYENIKTELYSTGITQETWLSFVWIINNTGSDLTYNNPTGSGTTTLANDKFDLWLKTQAGAASTYTKIINAAAATTASKDLQNLYIGNNPSSGVKKHEFRLDNVVVKDISPSDSKVTTTLSWSPAVSSDEDWDSGNNRLNKKTSDADFTFTASTTSNTLGAITYESSNTSVVTVSETGKVHMVGAGNATITATLAESGCYKEATASYNIAVTDDCDDEAGTIGTEDLGCDGIQMTVTGHTTSGATVSYQWYKDGATIGGATSATYTATTAGEYYVVVTNTGDGHCAMASTNTITVEATETASASKIVNSWYVKNGRRTPDVALVQTEDATGFYVKIGDNKIWDEASSVTTGFAGCGFYLGTDGIIYLKGQQADGSEPSGLTAGDVTLKFTATACGGNSGEVSITIHEQTETTYKEVAFVVDGTKEGAWDAVTSGHADGTVLYEYLDSVGTAASARKFRLYECNIYKTVDEQAIREYYSQFDAILITDNPDTGTKIGNKSCVNAFGTMVDIRPILTMEAWVSKLANWKAKGVSGNPESPNPRQYGMKLQCKDHAIFNGLSVGSNVKTETIEGVDYWTVLMVDSTKSPYSGVAYNSETSDKPALQGFAASDVSGLLLLGEISKGTLYVGVERQEEPAARLMLLGLNAKALPNALTDEGKIVIKNALSYLLETDMEQVDDCSNYFTGATSSDWNTATNWSKGVVPNSPTNKARILKPCVISSGSNIQLAEVDIATDGASSKIAGVKPTGKLTIEAGAILTVGGKIRAAEAPYFNSGDLKPTEEVDLVVNNTSSSNQAALIFNNDAGDTKATVNLYSIGRKVSETYQYQYLAIPMQHLPVNPSFAGLGIYTYVWLEASGWERRGYYDDVYAFEGLGITTSETTASQYEMKGTLASTVSQEIPITADGKRLNLIGNSWTAPIQISKLEKSDFGDASESIEQTVYIYCTGNGNATTAGTTETAGQWLAIPFSAAGFGAWDGLKVIPAMQAFQIKTSGAGTLTLDYDKHVRGGSTDLTSKLRAPKRTAAYEDVELMRIRVADSKTHTDLYLFEGEQFSDEFDNGWEANYRVGTNESAKLYARVSTGVMSVAAMSDLEGTPVYFIPGQETEYTFTFGGAGMGYYLNDMKLKKSTLISADETYSFLYEKGDAPARFYISRTPIDAPQTPTGVDNTHSGSTKVRKVIINDKVYIFRGGHMYSVDGRMVK